MTSWCISDRRDSTDLYYNNAQLLLRLCRAYASLPSRVRRPTRQAYISAPPPN